jgi:hypothetical protein
MTARYSGLTGAERIEVDGFAEAQELFWRRGWTDGLPIVPPTERLIEQFLIYAGVEAGLVVGEIPERGRQTTAEQVAINAVMAGCVPEHFPVVLAAWQSVTSPAWNLNSGALSTSGPAPLIIVNGPIVDRLAMRSGGNVFGPGNRANASIGRAMRLLLINLASATGPLDVACMGHPGKYSYCIAEDVDGLDGWEPLHVQRGFSPDISAVTVINCEAPIYVRDEQSKTADRLLANIADHVHAWNQPGAGVIVLNPEHRSLMQTSGLSKSEVAKRLWDLCGRSVADMKRGGRLGTALLLGLVKNADDIEPGDEETIFRYPRDPEDFVVVGAGAPGWFSHVIAPWGGGVFTEAVTSLVAEPGCSGECFV